MLRAPHPCGQGEPGTVRGGGGARGAGAARGGVGRGTCAACARGREGGGRDFPAAPVGGMGAPGAVRVQEVLEELPAAEEADED